jgi:hypothetical protein
MSERRPSHREAVVGARGAVRRVAAVLTADPAMPEAEIARSRLVAGLIGPCLLAVAATEAANLEAWSENDPRITYLDGMVLFGAGATITRLHPRPLRGWPAAVTGTGWLLGAAGLARMAFPRAAQPRRGRAVYSALGSLFALGALLTFQAYRPRRSPQSTPVATGSGRSVE